MDDIKQNIIGTVNHLAHEIGQRCYKDLDKLAQAADYIEYRLRSAGCETERQGFIYRDNTYCTS